MEHFVTGRNACSFFSSLFAVTSFAYYPFADYGYFTTGRKKGKARQLLTYFYDKPKGNTPEVG
jgi:hypothetical protein